MSQGPLCPNLTKKGQAEVSQMANRNLSRVILLGGLSVNLNHLIIEFYRFMHFAIESALKFSLHTLWKMVLLVVHDFQNGGKFRMLRNVSIYFLLFYHNNIMLKTEIMLDYW